VLENDVVLPGGRETYFVFDCNIGKYWDIVNLCVCSLIALPNSAHACVRNVG